MINVNKGKYCLVARIPGHDVDEVYSDDMHTLRVIGDALIAMVETSWSSYHSDLWQESEIADVPTIERNVLHTFDEHDYNVAGVTIFDLTFNYR